MSDDDPAYEATDASGLIDEVFGGKLPIKEAIEKLRTKLLDLSSQNRLLKYRHPRGRCIQIAGTPNLNQVFAQLIDGKPVRLLPVSDPLPFEVRGQEETRCPHPGGETWHLYITRVWPLARGSTYRT